MEDLYYLDLDNPKVLTVVNILERVIQLWLDLFFHYIFARA